MAKSASSAAALQRYMSAASVDAVDVDRLIADYRAIEGFDAAAMNRRIELVSRLGDSDDDKAVTFLQAEYENLSQFPEAVRVTFELKLTGALDGLDTYDSQLDDPIIAAGAGKTAVEAAAYADAMARKKRKKTLMDWIKAPFKWVGSGLTKLWNGLTGKKKPKKRRKPKPKPDPMPPAPQEPPLPA